jgi:5-carboxymethyl-2-hydroxymuconate isomerase
MPHLVIVYTPDLEPEGRIAQLCRSLADTMLAQRDEAGQAVFPVGGTRVLAYPAAHYAVSDGSGEHGFAYLNLRVARGRSPAVLRAAGEALARVTREHFAPLLATRHFGLTVQIDEAQEVYDAKVGNLHALFAPR